MCFGKQPEAPVNKPDYAPEDADTAFKAEIKKPDGTVEAIPNRVKGSVPSVKPSTNPIRM